MSSRSVATRTETRTVDGETETITVTEETITHPDGSVEKKTTTNTTRGPPPNALYEPVRLNDDWAKTKMGLRNSCPAQADGSPPAKPMELAEFQRRALAKHNEHRAKHGAQPLQLNQQLCQFAQEWAEKMSSSGKFAHRPGVKFGENIFYGMNSRGMEPLDCVDKWYGEIANYDFAKPGFAQNTGHFTQVVWAGSKELGIGFAMPNSTTVYVVANYDPAGNVHDHFPANVHPPK